MNESEFRRLVREAVGQPPPPPTGEQVHAYLLGRSERRRHRVVAATAFGLAVIVVAVLLGGYRLLSFAQHPTTPAVSPAPTASAPAATPSPAPTPTPTAAPTPTPAPVTPRFTSFPLSSFANPGTAAVNGPGGDIWYTVHNDTPRIGRISRTGQVRTYPLPGNQAAVPESIAFGADGALWFVRGDLRSAGNAVMGRLTVDGHYSEFPLPVRITDVSGPVAGPDGALWFTELAGNKIGRMTLTGQVREFALPGAPDVQCGQYCPSGIVPGPDGALWFVNTQLTGVPGIGRITTAGTMTFYSLPRGSVPSGIVAGPDGNLWFTEARGPGLGRVTPDGTVTEFAVPGLHQTAVALFALSPGPDRAVWFAVEWGPGAALPSAPIQPGQLGRIAPDGTVSLYTLPGGGVGVTGDIVLGQDGALWAFGDTTVVRVTLS